MALQSHSINLIEPLAPNAEWVHESSAQVEIKLYHGHTGPVKSCQLIENKNWLITGSNDNTARIWDFQSGKEIHRYKLNHDMAAIPAVRINQEATRLYSCGWDKTVRCFDVETGKEIWKGVHEHIVTNCHISHDGKSLCSGTDLDSVLSIWDTATGVMSSRIPNVHESTITSCQFNISDDRIITTSTDKTTKFFDLVTHRSTMTLRGHEGVVSNCTFNKFERLYATCSWDKTVLLYDATVGSFRREGPLMLPKLHEGSIAACHMSEDGKLLVTGGYDLRIVLWDLDNMTHKLGLRGHRDWINDVCLTSDNTWIISVSNDCDIRLWHVANCDNIKQVIEQNKTLKNAKIISCSKCGKSFSSNKLQRENGDSAILCVFCRLEQKQKNSDYTQILHDYDRPGVLNDQASLKSTFSEPSVPHF
ncbi:unnamed protein product [Rotaria magnacalcarata]|uniref:Uncharacterized protein n=2 Tax=Rotaria magnacalcarata TaxID=392030 RepID=A0A816V3H0_9BILA|nr:unnamed protein product [Rotaria magnacalcarata]CAF2116545.1 unnamed protein product [Rotaria magnacalcarata]CAF3965022.1 unnamed protein product [Rotaria magnacalcarata]CAF4041890.1 unnamed protein product [Rotaria magnacalcarata]